MKKLIITLEYAPRVGGISSYIYNFLINVNHEEYVLYAPKEPGDQEFDSQVPWKTYRRVPYTFLWPRWIRMVFQVWQIVKKEEISEIHIHHVLPVGYVGWIINRFLKVPYVVFLHGSDVSIGTKTQWKQRWFSRIIHGAKRVVVNSHFLENKLKTRVEGLNEVTILYPCPSENFLNRVPDEKLLNLKDKLALNGKKVVLTVSRMVDGKGYPHIIRLLSSVSKEIPNLVWIFIGDGPKKGMVMDLVNKYSMQNVVRLLGAMPNRELPQYYQVADLFVLLSHQDQEAEESWGSVFLEASASGIPVVAGRVGGVEEAVEHMRSGIVVDVYQSKSVVKTIVDLLNNRGFAQELGNYGRQRVEREFLWKKQISKL